MKKMLFAALAATTVIAAPAFAQSSDNDSTTISGEIALVCDIDAPAGITNLNLNSAAEQTVGNVTVQCNSANGYTVKASSDNNGLLKHGSANTTYAYTVGTSGFPFASLASLQTIPVPGANSGAVGPFTVPLKVKVGNRTGAAYAGTYSDTIRLSVDAN